LQTLTSDKTRAPTLTSSCEGLYKRFVQDATTLARGRGQVVVDALSNITRSFTEMFDGSGGGFLFGKVTLALPCPAGKTRCGRNLVSTNGVSRCDNRDLVWLRPRHSKSFGYRLARLNFHFSPLRIVAESARQCISQVPFLPPASGACLELIEECGCLSADGPIPTLTLQFSGGQRSKTAGHRHSFPCSRTLLILVSRSSSAGLESGNQATY